MNWLEQTTPPLKRKNMKNKMVIGLVKYFHLILGIAGLLATVYNMINTGNFTGHFSSLLSSILFIVIAFKIKLILFHLQYIPQAVKSLKKNCK
jgi:hypothetical protein